VNEAGMRSETAGLAAARQDAVTSAVKVTPLLRVFESPVPGECTGEHLACERQCMGEQHCGERPDRKSGLVR
jgi:hypothetical protein